MFVKQLCIIIVSIIIITISTYQVMHISLRDLQRALKGLVVLSAELEAMGNACFDQRVPSTWTSAAYPSLKPLGPWFKDLMQRLTFVSTWIELNIPPAFWISGFFFPQGIVSVIIGVIRLILLLL